MSKRKWNSHSLTFSSSIAVSTCEIPVILVILYNKKQNHGQIVTFTVFITVIKFGDYLIKTLIVSFILNQNALQCTSMLVCLA